MLDEITYDSFGNVLSETNPAAGDRFRFTARELDAALSLYYYRARWYDPQAGRFLREDPLSFTAGDTNLYRYVFNSPVGHTDPLGTIIWGGKVGFGFSFIIGAYVEVYWIWDHLGNKALVLVPSGGLGIDVSVGGQFVVGAGTVPEFIKGWSVGLGGGFGVVGGHLTYTAGCGISGGGGVSIPWVPYWIFRFGGAITWSPGANWVIWKNF